MSNPTPPTTAPLPGAWAVTPGQLPSRTYTKLANLVGHLVALRPVSDFTVWASADEGEYGSEWSGYEATAVVIDGATVDVVGNLRIGAVVLVDMLGSARALERATGTPAVIIGRLERGDGGAYDLADPSAAERELIGRRRATIAAALGVESIAPIEHVPDLPTGGPREQLPVGELDDDEEVPF